MGGELSRRDAFRAAGAVLAASSAGPAAAAGTAPGAPDLAGKVLVVQTHNRPLANPVILGECRFEPQGGRVFLVGVRQPCAANLPSWTDGVRCCIAWECIEEYLVFNSLSDYYSRLRGPGADPAGAEEGGAEGAGPGAAPDSRQAW